MSTDKKILLLAEKIFLSIEVFPSDCERQLSLETVLEVVKKVVHFLAKKHRRQFNFDKFSVREMLHIRRIVRSELGHTFNAKVLYLKVLDNLDKLWNIVRKM